MSCIKTVEIFKLSWLKFYSFFLQQNKEREGGVEQAPWIHWSRKVACHTAANNISHLGFGIVMFL